jgi:hypothetical protein
MHGAVFQRELGGISALSAGKYIQTFSSNENRTPGGRVVDIGYRAACFFSSDRPDTDSADFLFHFISHDKTQLAYWLSY